MARIRSLHPGLLTDEAFMQLTLDCPLAVTLLIGLWMEADDSGTFAWKPLTLKARILPAAPVRLEDLLEVLARANFIRRFEIEGRAFGVVRNFVKFQRQQTPTDIHPFTAEMRAYAGFIEGNRPRAATGRPRRDLFDDEFETQSGKPESSFVFRPLREEEGGKRENPPPPPASADAAHDRKGDDRPFGELTGAEIVAFPTANPLEAEARVLAKGLPLALDRDFEPIAKLVAGGGALRSDVLAVIEEARERREKCPKSWVKLASWAAAKARERTASAVRSGARAFAAAPPGPERWRAHFEAVWAGFPRDKTASRSRAEAAFAALGVDDQSGFAASIGAVAAHIRGLKLTQPYDLARFIAERRFEGFSRSPARAGPAKVRVARDSPAGEAWERFWRATQGRGAPWAVGDGFWSFDTEFPPSDAATGAA